MLKFSSVNINFQHFIIFRDTHYSELFYYLNLKPHISFFTDRPAIILEYEKKKENITQLVVRFKINYLATPFEINEINDFLRSKFRIKNPYLAPAILSESSIHLQLTYLKEVIWTSPRLLQSMNGRYTQIAHFVVKNEVAEKLYHSISRGGANVEIFYEAGVLGTTPENPAKLFIHWADLHQVFNTSLKKYFKSSFIEEEVNKWMLKNLKDIVFNKVEENIRTSAANDMIHLVKKQAFKRLFVKQNPLEDDLEEEEKTLILPLKKLEIKYYLRELSTIHPDAETLSIVWKDPKVFPYKFQSSFKELVKNIFPIEQYFEDITHKRNSHQLTFYVGLAQHTFEFVNIRKIEVQIDIIHKKTNSLEKQVLMNFEKGGAYLRIEECLLMDKQTQYDLEFRLFYHIVDANNFTFKSIEAEPQVQHETHLLIDPSTHFHIHYFRFLLDKAKRLSIFDLIIAKINFRTNPRSNHVWEIAESLDKNVREIRLAYASTVKNIEAKVDIEYFLQDLKIANTTYAKNDCIIIDNPFENCWDVEIDCTANWDRIRKVLVEAYCYEIITDTVHAKRIEFNENELQKPISFSKKLMVEENSFYFRIICVTRGGSIICQSGLKHSGEKLSICDQITSTRTIHGYLPPEFSFEGKKYTRIGWSIRYLDKKNKINFVSEPKYFTKQERYQQITHAFENLYFARYEYCLIFENEQLETREKSIWIPAEYEQLILNIE